MGFSTCIAFCARPLTDDGQKYIPMPTSCCNPAPRGMSVFYVKNRNITNFDSCTTRLQSEHMGGYLRYIHFQYFFHPILHLFLFENKKAIPNQTYISRSLLFVILILPLKIPLPCVCQVLDLEIRKQNKPRILFWFHIVYEVHKHLPCL